MSIVLIILLHISHKYFLSILNVALDLMPTFEGDSANTEGKVSEEEVEEGEHEGDERDTEMDEGEEDEADDLEVGPQEDGSVGDHCVITEVVRHPQYGDDCHDES